MRQRPAALGAAGVGVSGSGDCGGQFAGVWVDGLDGDVVAEAFKAADVIAAWRRMFMRCS